LSVTVTRSAAACEQSSCALVFFATQLQLWLFFSLTLPDFATLSFVLVFW
jgi:hypothetical protein